MMHEELQKMLNLTKERRKEAEPNKKMCRKEISLKRYWRQNEEEKKLTLKMSVGGGWCIQSLSFFRLLSFHSFYPFHSLLSFNPFIQSCQLARFNRKKWGTWRTRTPGWACPTSGVHIRPILCVQPLLPHRWELAPLGHVHDDKRDGGACDHPTGSAHILGYNFSQNYFNKKCHMFVKLSWITLGLFIQPELILDYTI